MYTDGFVCTKNIKKPVQHAHTNNQRTVLFSLYVPLQLLLCTYEAYIQVFHLTVAVAHLTVLQQSKISQFQFLIKFPY